VGLTRSVFYYRKSAGKKGKQRSTYTRKKDGSLVANSVVVEQIKMELKKEFVDYGYVKMTYCLRDNYHYIINEKKVYLLMKDHNLLYKPVGRNKSKRVWVRDLVPLATKAFEFWEFDIKYIYIAGQRRNALMLTVIDVVTRYNMGWSLEWSIKKEDVIALFAKIFQRYHLPEAVTVRNDNGSQFIAKLTRDYLEEMKVKQEFCHPATPEENGHIESYHSLFERAVCKRFEFDTLEDAQSTIKRFDTFYCNERIHSGIGFTSPRTFAIKLGVDPKYLCKSNEAETGSAGEQPARNSLIAVDSSLAHETVSTVSAEVNQLHQMPQKTQQANVEFMSSL
jgi:transposase InsO family protein